MSNERHSTLDVMRRLQSEIDAGATVTLSKDGYGELYFVEVVGGTQLTGGCMCCGDTVHEALEIAFDMDVDDE